MSSYNSKHESVFSRLRFVRSLSGLTRNEIEKKYGLPEITLKRWETGNIPLSKKGAKRCIDIYRQEGIIATESWIFDRSGSLPLIMVDYNTEYKYGDLIINNFYQTFKNCVVLRVPDNSMLPRYCKNEMVVGDIYVGDLAKLHNKDCIIMLDDDSIILRKLIYQDDNKISFISTNPTITENPLLYNPRFRYLAPVLWHQIGVQYE